MGNKKSLVIVESPTKAKTINKYLGESFTVKSSMGHLIDLPKSRLAVDIQKGFQPDYITIRGRGKILSELRKEAAKCERVYLAADSDREGEAISFHIKNALEKGRANLEIKRVVFNEITRDAIEEAVKNPRDIDLDLVNAQKARRILDRLVGYNLSPLLWEKIKKGLSAGRVQSVALRIICEREEEIERFVPKEYWSIEADFKKEAKKFTAKLFRFNGEKVEIGSEAQANGILGSVAESDFVVKEIEEKKRSRRAPPPFTTSKLQQAAGVRLGFVSGKTMLVAQQLYEGIGISEGPVGLITYMRTDSVRVSQQAQAEAKKFIIERFSEKYVPEKPNLFKVKSGAQDAHEAIRPTSLEYPPAALKGILTRDQLRLYELIWKRFVASQMEAAEFEQTAVDILCDPAGAPAGGYLFRASGSVPKFAGFLEVYEAAVPERRDEGGNGETGEENGDAGSNGEKQEENVLPPLAEGEVLTLRELTGNQHFTQPPPRFSESSLIKELEEQGIGRPSTYASIVKTIRERGYVKVDEGKFRPTGLGTIVTDLLQESFPKVMDVAFTARMEEELDQIEDGERELVQAMVDFYQPFSEELERAKIAMPTVKEELIATGIPCSACGAEMVIRFGRAGRFLACRTYPACRNTADFRQTPEGIVEIVPPEETGTACEKCGKPMIVRNWKGARYIACSGYPDCRNSKPYPVGISCPECKVGEVVERSSRFGKIFYSCSRYPDCRFASWGRPIAQSCPACGYPAMAERVRRDGSTHIACLRKGCKGRAGEPVPAKTEEAV